MVISQVENGSIPLRSTPKRLQQEEDSQSGDRPKYNLSQKARHVGLGRTTHRGIFCCKSLFYGVKFALDVFHGA